MRERGNRGSFKHVKTWLRGGEVNFGKNKIVRIMSKVKMDLIIQTSFT
jgi:hypothetical protein